MDILHFWIPIQSLFYVLVIWSAEDRDGEPNRTRERKRQIRSRKQREIMRWRKTHKDE